MRLLKPIYLALVMSCRNEKVARTLVAIDHVLLDYYRTRIDGCEGLCLPSRIPYIIGVFAPLGRVVGNSQDMAGKEVFVPDEVGILGAGFSILGIEKDIGGGYKYNLSMRLAFAAPNTRLA